MKNYKQRAQIFFLKKTNLQERMAIKDYSNRNTDEQLNHNEFMTQKYVQGYRNHRMNYEYNDRKTEMTIE